MNEWYFRPRCEGYTGPGTTCANEMNFVMNHAPGQKKRFGIVDQRDVIIISTRP